MTIELKCPGCGVLIKAPDKYAGKTAKCPKCARQVRLPDAAPGAPGAAAPADAIPLAPVDSAPTAPNDSKPSPSQPHVPPGAPDVMQMCPSCQRMLDARAAQCPSCGYNLKTRRRESLGSWWDESTAAGCPIAAVLLALVSIPLWVVVFRAVGGPLRPTAEMQVLAGVVWCGLPLELALVVSLLLRLNSARLVLLLLLLVFALTVMLWILSLPADQLIGPVERSLPRLLQAGPAVLRTTRALQAFLSLISAIVGWSMLTAVNGTRKTIAIGAACVVVVPSVISLAFYHALNLVLLVSGA